MIYKVSILKIEFANLSLTASLFIGSFLVVALIVTPLQSVALPIDYASILFLPHGVRIFAVVFYGPARGFLYLLLSSIAVELILDGGGAISMSLIGHIIGAGCVPVAMMLLRFGFGGEAISLQHVDRRTWRGLLPLILISSLINSLLQTVMVHASDLTVTDIYLSLRFILGDVLGAAVMLLGANVLLKRWV